MKLAFAIDGMTCKRCVAHVEEAIRAVPGVEHCAVSLTTGAEVEAQDAAVDAQIIAAVTAAGYSARRA